MSTFYFIAALCSVALSCAPVTTRVSQLYPDPAASTALAETPLPPSFEFPRIDVTQDTAKPRPNGVSVNFGQVVQLKAFYVEKREPVDGADSNPADAKLRRHFDVLATSSVAGTAFTGEGELAYSQLDPLDGSSARTALPMMLRLAFKTRWEALSYGAEYKSSDAGFVGITGSRADFNRDDARIWGERSWGALKIRGSLNQVWEKPQDGAGARLTRSAGASLNYSHRRWVGSLASTYVLFEEGTAADEDISLANHAIAVSYRPNVSISLVPSLSLRQQWNRSTGVRTETPVTALEFVYTPYKELLRLTGTTSVAHSFNTGGTSEMKTFRTGAALDWNIGEFVGAGDRLSVWLNYDHRLDLSSPGSSHRDVRTMLLLKVTGF